MTRLALNTGQIEGLPANPRQWTSADVDRIAKSLKETPELLQMRPLIVTPHGHKYVILAGSLRYCGLQKMNAGEAPCIVFEGEADKMKEIVLKDNGSFGAWDMDALANQWDDLPLADWGVPAWETEGEGEQPNNLDEEEPKLNPFVCKITFDSNDAMMKFMQSYKDIIEEVYHCTISLSGGAL